MDREFLRSCCHRGAVDPRHGPSDLPGPRSVLQATMLQTLRGLCGERAALPSSHPKDARQAGLSESVRKFERRVLEIVPEAVPIPPFIASWPNAPELTNPSHHPHRLALADHPTHPPQAGWGRSGIGGGRPISNVTTINSLPSQAEATVPPSGLQVLELSSSLGCFGSGSLPALHSRLNPIGPPLRFGPMGSLRSRRASNQRYGSRCESSSSWFNSGLPVGSQSGYRRYTTSRSSPASDEPSHIAGATVAPVLFLVLNQGKETHVPRI